MRDAVFFSADDDIAFPVDERLWACLLTISPHDFAHSTKVGEHSFIVNELAAGSVEVLLDRSHVDGLERIPIAQMLL